MYKKGQTTGSNKANRELVARSPLLIERSLSRSQEELLYDPQTSGGLLLSLPGEQAQKLLADLHSAGIDIAVKVGEIVEGAVGLTVR
jgi:selenide,water dikinase